MSAIKLQKNWEQVKHQVSHLYKSALRLSKSESITKSKLGGKPWVDNLSFQWPRVDNEPLAFIAQLDLAELNTTLVIDWLPSTGTLLFFYDIEIMPWGIEPDDNQFWKVIYHAQAETKIDFPDDLAEEFRFNTVYLNAIKIEQLPSLERLETKALNLTEQQMEAYEELCDRELGDQPSHQVSGYPDYIQCDDMEYECQQVANQLNSDDNANEWRLLFQFDTDEEAEMIWGDCGSLYFWIKESDARAGNFDKVWLILQCY